jgi:DNA helicase-2/ATP-dependent DNA helicase PcrA
VLFKNRENLIGDEISLRRNKKDYELLKQALEQPYFGRIDIYEDEENITYYIGKQSIRDLDDNIIVVDWRMPIAKVYYNFTTGNPIQEYMVENSRDKNLVEVLRKREFLIKNGKLINMKQQVADPNSKLNNMQSEKGEEIAITDSFLKDIIENSESTGYLKEIIASIQKEQDQAIRMPINQNVIVQGVAGSGKSSIALHRISFLLFNNKHIKPEDILILGPSHLFISSFQELLPELDLEGICQSTFAKFSLDIIEKELKLNFPIDKSKVFFEKILGEDTIENKIKLKQIEFKGSANFVILLDIFIEEMKKQYEERLKSISLFGHYLGREDLLKIFHGYDYLPFARKVERFITHVDNIYKEQLKKSCDDIKSQYEYIIGTYLNGGGLSQQELVVIKRGIEKVYKNKVYKLENEYREKMKQWKQSMEISDVLTIYKRVLSFEVLEAFTNEIGSEIPELFRKYPNHALSEFDLPPILYIYTSLYDVPRKFSHIVIDEAQDLSFMHFAVLKKFTKTMTILGDLDQSIYIGYGQENWTDLLRFISNDERSMILNLNTSYRSTKEIIEAADKVLTNQFNIRHQKITPINRSGKPVEFQKISDGEELLNQIKKTIDDWKRQYKRIAIIHNDEQKATTLADFLREDFIGDVVYVSPDKDVQHEFISVITSYDSKGMEFDAVILVNVNNNSFPKDDLHARLLYVLMTRAQKELKIFYQDTPSPLLEGLVEKQTRQVSKYDIIL